jgi:hypothetical protein
VWWPTQAPLAALESFDVTPEQVKLIMGLVVYPAMNEPALSKEEFLRRWPADDGPALGLTLLRDAITHRSADEVEYAMVVRARFGFSEDHIPMLLTLADEDWHGGHEDVAFELGLMADQRAVPALIRLAQIRLPYLDYDESAALASKALHALSRINTISSRRFLEQACTDDRDHVRATAEELSRR